MSLEVPSNRQMVSAGFEPRSLEEAMQLATQLSKSGLLPQALRGKPGDVLVIYLTGRELGLSLMQSLRGINVIDGKPAMSADLLVGLALQHPACEYFRVVESTGKRATYETKRRGSPEPVRMSFTIEQAQAANLTGKFNWKSYPDAMLRARAAAALARAVYPDALHGVYTHDELDKAEPAPAPARDVQAERVVEAEVAPPEAAKAEATAKAVEAVREVFPEAAPAEPSALDQVLIAIKDAATIEQLDALVPKLKELSDADKQSARKAYGARKTALTPKAEG